MKGHYQFKQKNKVILEGDNLITLLGESFFLNRLINNEFEVCKYIELGTARVRPRKSDRNLGNKTIRKQATTSVDLSSKSIILEASFSAREVINTTEIGASNGDILISHDLYDKIDSEMLDNTTSDVIVTYSFDLTSNSFRQDFRKLDSYNHTYYIPEPTQVIGVIEKSTNSGYKCVNSIPDVEENSGSYYYDVSSQNLYIHTTNNMDPNNNEICIQTR